MSGALVGAGVLGIAFAVRCLYVADVWGSASVMLPLGDSLAYHEAALRILGGDWLGDEVFYQDPLYPYLLAALYALFGVESVGVLLFQAALGAATVLLTWAIARRLFGEPSALAAGAFAALMPVTIFYDAFRLKVTLSLFLVALALWALLRADARRTAPAWLTAGFAFGLATLTRGNYLAFIPVLLLWVGLAPASPRVRVRATGLAALGLALAIAPVTLRNWAVGDDLVLITSQAGQNFYIGNHRENDTGTYKAPRFVIAHAHHEQDDFRDEAERRAGRPLSPSERSRFWIDAGLEEIRADPAHFARHTGRKLHLLAIDYEMPDNQSIQFLRAEESWLLSLPLPGWGALLPLALCGMWAARRDRGARLLILYAAVYAATLALVFTVSRYRVALAPVVAVFAGHAVCLLAGWARARRAAPLALALAFLALAWTAAYWPVPPEDFTLTRANLGIASARRADVERARAVELRAAGDEPGARAALAREAELARGAETELHKGLDSRPQNKRLQRALRDHLLRRATALESLGEIEAALGPSEALIASFPRRVDGYVLVGSLHTRAGRYDRAERALGRGLSIAPGNARVREAIARLRQARAGLDPDSPPLPR